jgi:hypothetical protein
MHDGQIDEPHRRLGYNCTAERDDGLVYHQNDGRGLSHRSHDVS